MSGALARTGWGLRRSGGAAVSGSIRHDFNKLNRLPPYVLAEVIDLMKSARRAGHDIIDLGMRNPDLPPPAHVIDKLCEVARKPDAHGYSASSGIPGIRKAQANYYGRRFNVDLAPYPTLTRIEANCLVLDAFKRAMPEAQPDAEK